MKWTAALSLFFTVNTAVADEATDWSLMSVPDAGSFWQNQSLVPIDAITQTVEAINQDGGSTDGCPEGMVRVQGEMLRGNVQGLQDRACIEWLDGPDAPVRRCAQFDRELWLELSAELSTEPMDFCIDRFEYPNRPGEYPVVSVSWNEAGDICESAGQRLCTETEWTFACEGEEATPYPYGYERDSTACNIDRPWRDYDDEETYGSLSPRSEAGDALASLWQGAVSGAYPECTSPFGVYDMTGNVDEWATSVSDEGYPSVMKGGYWSTVRNRCRPTTRAHAPSFVFYQQGFRCCGEPEENTVIFAATDVTE